MLPKSSVLPLALFALLLLQSCAVTSRRSIRSSRDDGPATLWDEEEEEDGGYHAQGLYSGARLSNGQILGDLEGDTAIVDDVAAPTEFNFLPEVDPGLGVGIELSNRWERWEIALSYDQFEYDGDFGGSDMDVDGRYLDLTFRRYYAVHNAVQPYLLAGVGMSDLEIEDGALDAMGFSQGNLDSGVNYNVGGGVRLYISPYLAVWGQVMWRFGNYDEVDARFGQAIPERSIDSDGWQATGGVSFRLIPPRN